MFVQADFGLDQELRPPLVEIQGFPTLYAYQPLLAEAIGGRTESTTACMRCQGE